MVRALKILEKELTSEEFLIYLQAITKRAGDSVKELREKMRNLTLNKVVEMARSLRNDFN